MCDVVFLMRDVFKFKGIWYAVQNISNYLNSLGLKTQLLIVDDINKLYEQLYELKPRLVFVEAIWLHPNKVKKILNIKSIKNVIVHFHSDIPFFATEIFGMEWIYYYKNIDNRIIVSANTQNFANAFDFVLNLPNIYEGEFSYTPVDNQENIVVFQSGAIRLMKNVLTQLVSSMKFADKIDKRLVYKYNNVKNNGGESVYRNLLAIKNNTNHILIELEWLNGEKYIKEIRESDIGLQLSFSESFNNVAADFVLNGKPIIAGDTIFWLPEEYKSTSYVDINKIVEKIEFLYENKNNISLLKKAYNNLCDYNNNSKDIWKKFIEKCL